MLGCLDDNTCDAILFDDSATANYDGYHDDFIEEFKRTHLLQDSTAPRGTQTHRLSLVQLRADRSLLPHHTYLKERVRPFEVRSHGALPYR